MNESLNLVEGINESNVTAWLADHVPALMPPVSYSLIAGGNSNLTYRCEDADGNIYVLRRPPLGQVLQSAHNMSREHRIIEALKDSDVPVATNYGVCQDPSVNKADFYVMGYVDGLVLNDEADAITMSAGERVSASKHLIDILCRLHAIDPDDVGLGDLGRKEAYLERQIKRWTSNWEAVKTDEIPEMEESCRLLKEQLPQQMGASIVHGDFRLGNMIVADGEIKAVLDWELCTLGGPLADVGYLLNNWVLPDDVLGPGEGYHTPTRAGGFMSREQITEYYATNTGRDLSQINYYRAFSYWRLTSIAQGAYKRYINGTMGENRDVDLEEIKDGINWRAQAALELLQS